MKRFLLSLIFVFCIYLIAMPPSNASGVLCNSNKTVCTVGHYTLHGTNLYAKDGILCNSNGTLCTNGYSVLNTGTSIKKESKPKKKEESIKITSISITEALNVLSQMYREGLIMQNEFNKIKKTIATIDLNRVLELQKIGNLYKNGMVTQSEYNRAKNIVLR